MSTYRPNRFRLYVVGALGLSFAVFGSGCSSNPKTGFSSSGGTTVFGGATAQGGSTVSGGSTGQGGTSTQGGTTAAGGTMISGGISASGTGGATGSGGSQSTCPSSCFLVCQEDPPCNCYCPNSGGAGGSTTATGGNVGIAGAGGASSSSSGNSCYDSSGTIATTAKTCTLASDCKQVVQPTCCGAISEVGLAKSSLCTFPVLSCGNLGCASFDYQQAEDGKNTTQGGSIGLECVSGQCKTFVMAGGVDAGADANGGARSTGGAISSGGSSASGGSGGKGGAGGSGGTSSTGVPDASADKPRATMGTPCSSQDDCGLPGGMFLMCLAPGESSGCGICRMGPGDCSTDADCVRDGGSTGGTMICDSAPSADCYCHGAMICIVGCRTNADCRSGQACNPSHSCQNTCVAGDGTCPANYSCGASGFCQQNSCTSDSECSGFCVKGWCYQTRGTCEPIAA